MADTAGRALGASSITLFLEIQPIKNLWFNFSVVYGIIYLIFMIITVFCLRYLDRYHYIHLVPKSHKVQETVHRKFFFY